ncbi:carbon-nitrogen hydrolase [Metschnikowia bicuspidata]|uniref:Carbon-nitrogen hydrolase n=1 Tax=Metschnikowia bicuspidata TaxID=27322 RepID=A0A4P9Z9E6_9ASCO|nr:carbon-nitrogen hydrolase [Metschnikowia bicuspidata]RKP29253.1 carbon-nitrogen hydrolase [Metschnikowia bicuspidata]
MSTVRIAVGQMCSGSSLLANARVVSKAIDKAIQAKAKVLFLPEAADYISRNADHSVQLASRSRTDFLEPIQQKIRSFHSPGQKDDGIMVAIGVHEPASGENRDKKVQNNQLWISNTGEIVHRYQKVHLFDVNIPNGPILKESESVESGSKLYPPFRLGLTPPLSDFSVGLAICYDIRFPEFASSLRQKGVDIITYPSAFTTKTGEAHWKELGRARAIDTQCYVVMAAQCGEHDTIGDLTLQKKSEILNRKKRESYGLALIIGPWGEVLAEASNYHDRAPVDDDGDYYEIIVADIDRKHLDKIRTEMPVFRHRRPSAYVDS